MTSLKWIVFLVCIPAVICDFSILTRRIEKSTIPNSQNLERRLKCQPGYISNASGTKCLKVAVAYYDSCEEEDQCFMLLGNGGQCKDNKCVCNEKGTHYVNGKCHRTAGVNEWCTTNEQCFDGSEYQATSCKRNQCKCNLGFYQRGRTACRRKQKNVGDECLLDWDCDFANGTCVGNKCVQDGKPMGRRNDRTVIVTPTLKRAGGYKIGSECKNDTDCQSIGNSVCDVDGTCVCQRSHFPTEDKTGCIPEIGEDCNPSGESLKVEHAICRENTWTCPIDRTVSRDNRECIKLTENIDETCKVKEECRLFGPQAECSQANTCSCLADSDYTNEKHFCWHKFKDGSVLGTYCKTNNDCGTPDSICSNNQCVCQEHYFELDGQCVKGLGAECQDSEDCKPGNTVCDNSEHRCKCATDYVATSDDKCAPKSHYKGKCRYNEQCSAAVPHAFCNATEIGRRCNCEEGYFYNDKDECQLKKWLDDQCTESDECFAPNTRCKNRRCKCLPTYVSIDGQCMLELGSRCDDNDDCKIPNSFCENNKCACKTPYYELDGLCEAGQHAFCKVDEDCKHNGTVCLKDSCDCPTNFVDGTPEHRCMPKSDYLQECKYDVQCAGALNNTVCKVTKGSGVCECSDAHYYEEKECHLKKWMEDECTKSEECFTPNSHCKNNQCQCKPEYPRFYQERCNSSSAMIRPLFAFVGMILLALKVLF